MVYWAWPRLIERRLPSYPNMLASGTIALITSALFRWSWPVMRPRRFERSPITPPTHSSGVITSTRMIGSSSVGPALAFLHRRPRRSLKAEHTRIDFVIGAVGRGHLQVDHREAGEHAVVERAVDALLDPGHVFLRHSADHRVVLQLETRSRRLRLET